MCVGELVYRHHSGTSALDQSKGKICFHSLFHSGLGPVGDPPAAAICPGEAPIDTFSSGANPDQDNGSSNVMVLTCHCSPMIPLY